MSNQTSNQYLSELPGELDDAQKASVREAVSSKSPGLDAFAHMSDEWVAARVRMLMRKDPWFEPICSAGRDRIIRLVLKYEALLKRFEKACARVTELEGAAETTAPPYFDEWYSEIYSLGRVPQVQGIKSILRLAWDAALAERANKDTERAEAWDAVWDKLRSINPRFCFGPGVGKSGLQNALEEIDRLAGRAGETTAPRKFRIGDCVTVTQKGVVLGPWGDTQVIVRLRDGGDAIVQGVDLSRRDCDERDQPPTQVKAEGKQA